MNPLLRLTNARSKSAVWQKEQRNKKGSCLLCYFLQSPSRALSIRATALGDWAFYLSAASSHLPWKSRLFPPYAPMFCQASPVCSALSKFHYGMAGSTRRCSLRLSAWHVTVCNARGCRRLNTPRVEDRFNNFSNCLTFVEELGYGSIWSSLKRTQKVVLRLKPAFEFQCECRTWLQRGADLLPLAERKMAGRGQLKWYHRTTQEFKRLTIVLKSLQMLH